MGSFCDLKTDLFEVALSFAKHSSYSNCFKMQPSLFKQSQAAMFFLSFSINCLNCFEEIADNCILQCCVQVGRYSENREGTQVWCYCSSRFIVNRSHPFFMKVQTSWWRKSFIINAVLQIKSPS